MLASLSLIVDIYGHMFIWKMQRNWIDKISNKTYTVVNRTPKQVKPAPIGTGI